MQAAFQVLKKHQINFYAGENTSSLSIMNVCQNIEMYASNNCEFLLRSLLM